MRNRTGSKTARMILHRQYLAQQRAPHAIMLTGGSIRQSGPTQQSVSFLYAEVGFAFGSARSPTGESTAALQIVMRNSNSQFSERATPQATRLQRAYRAARWHQGSPYAAFREVLRVLLPYDWRRRAVHLSRRGFGYFSLRDWFHAQWPFSFHMVSPSPPSGPTNFYQRIRLLPQLTEQSVRAILDQPAATVTQPQLDVICFSIVDWSFRFQRPQQLMSQFAAEGHRVFYLNISDFLSQYARPKYSVKPIKHNVDVSHSLDNLHEVKIAVRSPLDLSKGIIQDTEAEAVLDSLDELRQAYNINDAIGYVMIPSWSKIAQATQQRWGWRIIYDCMDEWENFPRLKPEALTTERDLVQNCDFLVVTAKRLHDKWLPFGRPMALVRNAADYDFYTDRCRPNELLGQIKHPIIGYFGAIADWFDIELVIEAARQRPNYSFVLLGGIFDVDTSPLQLLSNIRLLGQQAYETMPEYLYHFDVCIIPFKVNPITEATDPVKLYEYLSGGKPVVAVNLPEMEPYRDVVYLADNPADFVAKLDAALAEDSPVKIEQRKALARQHTWEVRYRQITTNLADAIPRASIIIITYNNLALTKLCLESLIRNTEHPNSEIIVVDNHSTDGTPAYLKDFALRQSKVHVILNAENHGFARANNQAITHATGEHIVLLNNDTIVPPGWLSRLLWHLRDPQIGLVGPVTNFTGNEAKVEVPYRSWIEMEEFARSFTWTRQQQIADIHMLAMYCVAMRREVYNRICPLDERFGIGMFEDDDYSTRVRKAGLRVVCAADAFVHHFGQAAFGKLIESGTYNSLFDENRKKYEAKWQTVWQPHQHAELKFELHVMRD